MADPVTIGRRQTRVVHLTSAHPAFDVRIFHKEACTLADAGYEVFLVAVHEGRTVRNGVTVEGLSAPSGRFRRMLFSPIRVLRTARRLRPDVCHIHDPELIPVGLVLKLLGSRVIYDAHEDLGLQVLNKTWIPRSLRRPASAFARLLERMASRWLDAVVAATPGVAVNFPAERTTVVANYPKLAEFSGHGPDYHEREAVVAYVGGVTLTRGAIEMIEAIELVPDALHARLVIAGRLQLDVDETPFPPATDRVEYRGVIDRDGVQRLLSSARVGLVVLHPIPSYLESYPVKLFEYMAAGLPVVASDFPLWKSIVSGAGCGLVVDPLDVKAVAAAIEALLADPAAAVEMGRRGRSAVEDTYSWHNEGEKLIAVYDRLAGVSS